ncbi:MAG: hydrogenase expression protein HupH [Alphaproteobacteria bacterium]|nr:MAG: hydrogenase expression protein HupH [Alphaproteobacteria bacterium]
MDEAGVAQREAQLAGLRIAPDTEVVFQAVSWGAALGDSHHDMLLMDMSVFEAGLKAEEEGFDAVIVDTVSDSGLAALRSRLAIPVVGPGQAALHLAAMLGHRFTILTMWDEWFPLYRKILSEYALWPRLASMRSIRTRPDLKELLAGKEEVVFAKLLDEAEAAIAEDGADVIVLGSTTMHQSHGHLAANLPVPVINPGVAAFRMTELLLDLGLAHSKKAYPTPEVLQDDAILERRPPR